MRYFVLFLFLLLYSLTFVDVYADQNSRHIGVTRAEMVSVFSNLPLGFVFEEEELMTDNRPRVKAVSNDCPERHLTLEFIGPNIGYIQSAAVRYVLPLDATEKCRIKGEMTMQAMLHNIFSGWNTEDYNHRDWLSDGISRNRSSITYRNGAEIELFIINDGAGGKFIELSITKK